MKILCINCRRAELNASMVQLSGEFRGKNYTVVMHGLKCPNCGYMTVPGKGMAEFGKRLSEEYKAANGLVTSNELVASRRQSSESQSAFARRANVSIASLKRWELGKIQDRRSNELLLKAIAPQIQDTRQYHFSQQASTAQWVNWDQTSVGQLVGILPNAGSTRTGFILDGLTTSHKALRGLDLPSMTFSAYIASHYTRGANGRTTGTARFSTI